MILDIDRIHIVSNFYCLTTAFLAFFMKNGYTNYLLKFKSVKIKMKQIQIFDCFYAFKRSYKCPFIIMSVHLMSVKIRSNKVSYTPKITYILICPHQTFAKFFVSS